MKAWDTVLLLSALATGLLLLWGVGLLLSTSGGW